MVDHQLARRKPNLHSCFAYGHPCTSCTVHRQDWNGACGPRKTNESARKQGHEEGQIASSVASDSKGKNTTTQTVLQ